MARPSVDDEYSPPPESVAEEIIGPTDEDSDEESRPSKRPRRACASAENPKSDERPRKAKAATMRAKGKQPATDKKKHGQAVRLSEYDQHNQSVRYYAEADNVKQELYELKKELADIKGRYSTVVEHANIILTENESLRAENEHYQIQLGILSNAPGLDRRTVAKSAEKLQMIAALRRSNAITKDATDGRIRMDDENKTDQVIDLTSQGTEQDLQEDDREIEEDGVQVTKLQVSASRQSTNHLAVAYSEPAVVAAMNGAIPAQQNRTDKSNVSIARTSSFAPGTATTQYQPISRLAADTEEQSFVHKSMLQQHEPRTAIIDNHPESTSSRKRKRQVEKPKTPYQQFREFMQPQLNAKNHSEEQLRARIETMWRELPTMTRAKWQAKAGREMTAYQEVMRSDGSEIEPTAKRARV